MNQQHIITVVDNWLKSFIIKLNLCPFAKAEVNKNRVRYSVSKALNEEQLLHDLNNEIEHLNHHPETETSLLIHPLVLDDFHAYNDFLELCDAYLEQQQLDGVYQIASFHPDYQFSGSEKEDAENYSNKSPYPLLHILREESLTKAIDSYPDIDEIPQNNIKKLNQLGKQSCAKILNDLKNSD